MAPTDHHNRQQSVHHHTTTLAPTLWPDHDPHPTPQQTTVCFFLTTQPNPFTSYTVTRLWPTLPQQTTVCFFITAQLTKLALVRYGHRSWPQQCFSINAQPITLALVRSWPTTQLCFFITAQPTKLALVRYGHRSWPQHNRGFPSLHNPQRLHWPDHGPLTTTDNKQCFFITAQPTMHTYCDGNAEWYVAL